MLRDPMPHRPPSRNPELPRHGRPPAGKYLPACFQNRSANRVRSLPPGRAGGIRPARSCGLALREYEVHARPGALARRGKRRQGGAANRQRERPRATCASESASRRIPRVDTSRNVKKYANTKPVMEERTIMKIRTIVLGLG